MTKSRLRGMTAVDKLYMNQLITILIPNYKTFKLTQLCLRFLQQYTDLQKAHIIVIDNDSRDESTEYLRSLDWIKLIERKPESDDTPSLSHSRALDLALKQVTTPYVLVMHTDTIVKHAKWLDFLLQFIQDKSGVAGVGSWKLESKSLFRRVAKIIEQKIQLAWYWLIKKNKHAVQREHDYYLRSHCALYRTDLINQHQLTFSAIGEPAGKIMHQKLVAAGYQMIFLPSELLGKYVDHINHATMVLNPELGVRKKTIRGGMFRIKKFYKGLEK